MRTGRTHITRILLATATLAVFSVYGYYYACALVAKWAFAHQTYFAADELILIAIPQTDLSPQNKYLAEEGEFEWQGQMVDVLHREIRSDTLYIYGFRDAAETELKRVASWLYQTTPQPDQWPDSATKRNKWVKSFFLPHAALTVLPVQYGFLPARAIFSFSCSHHPLPPLDVIVPPPDL